jgi:hypothetical protein
MKADNNNKLAQNRLQLKVLQDNLCMNSYLVVHYVHQHER